MKTCVGMRRLLVEMDLKKINDCYSKRTYAYEKMQLFKDDLVNFDTLAAPPIILDSFISPSYMYALWVIIYIF